MSEAVARAIDRGRHLVVQAGTGTGKSLAYLVPVVLAGRTTVVATATKALQDQMTTKDLPFLAEHLGEEFEWAILKGRSNYLCLQRVREVRDAGSGQLELDDLKPSVQREVERPVGVGRSDHDGRPRRPHLEPHRPRPGPRSACRARSAQGPVGARSAGRASPSRPGAGPRRPTSSW